MRIVLDSAEETLSNGRLQIPTETELLQAERRARVKKPRRPKPTYFAGLATFLGVLLLPLTVGLLADASRGRERRIYQEGIRRIQEGEWDEARQSAEELASLKILSSTGRREAAALLFRLGYDREANRLLLGRKADPGNPRDRELRKLAAACQRAQAKLSAADRATDPSLRVQRAREALGEVPESPLLLQRVVEEELVAFTRTGDSELNRNFQAHYTELREKAPTLAAQVQKKAGEALKRLQ